MKCRWARGMCVDFAEWQAIKTKDGKPTDDCTWIYMYIYCVQMWLWIVSHHVSHTCIAYKCTRYASSRHCTLTQLPVLCTLLLWCYAIYSSLVVYFLLLYYYFEHCIVARKRYTWLFVLASCGGWCAWIAFRRVYVHDSITPNCMMFHCTLNWAAHWTKQQHHQRQHQHQQHQQQPLLLMY